MANIGTEIKLVPKNQIYKNINSFGVETGWYLCRELFHAHVKTAKIKSYFFSHADNATKQIADFIEKIEEHLNVYPRTVFCHTNMKASVSWIGLSPWWYDDMRHNFFTICLRAYPLATGRTWRNELFSYPYIVRTARAANRFLDGYTEYTGNFSGWVQAFEKVTDANLLLKLIKPDTPDERHHKIAIAAYHQWKKNGGDAQTNWTLGETQYLTSRKTPHIAG